MTRIDFYVLASRLPAHRVLLVCRLAEKAAGSGKRVFVHADDAALLRELDDRLWDFRANSFVAHRMIDSPADTGTIDTDPVQLSCAAPPPDRDLLINLSQAVPPFFSRFERTLEVVDDSDGVRQAGRARYRYYQHRGYPLKHHAVPAPTLRAQPG